MMYVRQTRPLGYREGGSRRRWKDVEEEKGNEKDEETGEGEGRLAGGDAARDEGGPSRTLCV